MHKSAGGPVEPGHGVHGPLVGLADILLAHHQLDPVPTLGLVQPLVRVESHLGSQRLGEDQHVSHDGRVGNDELVGLADGGGHPADGAPRVHHGLTAGHGGSSLQGTVLKYMHH